MDVARFSRVSRWRPSLVGAWVVLLTSSAALGQPVQPASPIDAEARAIAQRLWDKLLTKCGAVYYDPRASDGFVGHVMRESRGVAFRVLGRRLSDADRLNGYAWRGEAVMTASASRESGKDWHSNEQWLHYRDADRPNAFGDYGLFSVESEVRSGEVWKRSGAWFYRLGRTEIPAEKLEPTGLTCEAINPSLEKDTRATPAAPPGSVVWTPIPADENLGELCEIRLDLRDSYISFLEIPDAAGQDALKHGANVAWYDILEKTKELDTSSVPVVALRRALVTIRPPHEFRRILARPGGPPVTTTMLTLTRSGRAKSQFEIGTPRGPLEVSSQMGEYYLIRLNDARVGIIDRANYIVDTRPKVAK